MATIIDQRGGRPLRHPQIYTIRLTPAVLPLDATLVNGLVDWANTRDEGVLLYLPDLLPFIDIAVIGRGVTGQMLRGIPTLTNAVRNGGITSLLCIDDPAVTHCTMDPFDAINAMRNEIARWQSLDWDQSLVRQRFEGHTMFHESGPDSTRPGTEAERADS
jgi:hypothetical protein